MKKILSLSIVFFLFAFSTFSQTLAEHLFADDNNNSGLNRSAEAGFAEEEFRRGVQSYYRGFFNDAIIQFEKALSYLPDENLILDWLGKSYYRAGMEGTALEQWEFAKEAGYGGILLENKIEVVRERRVNSSFESDSRYTETGSFDGVNSTEGGSFQIFSQPVSILANSDGTIWLCAYGSNELALLDINGNVVRRVTGPLNGFDRPVDIIRAQDGKILVSESAGDRISVLSESGLFEKYIGKKGRGVGELVGPQYMAQDYLGNIYVSDFGNARISVFDKDGNGLFSFGKKEPAFSGLKGPTGIAIKGRTVYVADSVLGGVYQFDLSGNYVDVLVQDKTFKFPEAMKFASDMESLVISDRNRVLSIDLETGAVYEKAFTGNAPARITCAVPDHNGNLLAADFKNNEVYILSNMTELLGGLFVEIERVDAEKFPQVTMNVRVQNRRRQPVVGLRAENFYISEGKRPVEKLRFEGAAASNKSEDVAIIVDRSMGAECNSALDQAVRDIAAAMQGVGNITLISSGSIPVAEYTGAPSGLMKFSESALKSKRSPSCAFDLALRMAVNTLINGEPKRAVIYITDGKLPQNSFDRYGLTDLTAFMDNNSVAFSVITLKQGALDEELDYIYKSSYGKSYYVYRPEGLGSIVNDLLEVPNGLYQFSFVSTLATDMGRAYLPLEVETYIMNRSGRDETGYFAPLQ
ncbi:MAG: hypothetical protein IJS51_11380 [Treponema sp.]|nr:hypothetical protein [Treponema sp.]MBQ7620712.1 hypothetical protein [Treponema sp.]